LARCDHELGPWRWIHAGTETRAFLAFHRYLAGGPSQTGVEDRILEIVGEMAGADPPARHEPPVWLRRTREALDDSSDIQSVRDLAARVGVHPVSLTRAFRRHYGIPVSTYRRRERLRRAAREIERTDGDLTGIAHASGFSDQPHMCREVRRATGLTPGELRRVARCV
jgi:AraC family transcriptional regulator